MQVHIDRGGQRFGPYELEEVNTHLASGVLQPTDLAWAEGMPGWVPVTQFPGVTAPGAAAPPPPSAPGGAPPPTPPSTPVPVAAGNSAGKKKLLIGVGATVGVCAIGAAVWFFFIRGDDEPSEGNKAGGNGSGAKKVKTLAEFIKDKRIYFKPPPPGGSPVKMPETFMQFKADGTVQEGMILQGKAMSAPGAKGKYEIDGLTIKLSSARNGEVSMVFQKSEPAKGDAFTISGGRLKKETKITVSRIEPAKPIKPILDAIAGAGRPGGQPGKRPSGGFQGGSGKSDPFTTILRMMDKNRDGKLSKAETSQIPAWSNLFGRIDKNGDGIIERLEYSTYLRSVMGQGGGKGRPSGGNKKGGFGGKGRPSGGSQGRPGAGPQGRPGGGSQGRPGGGSQGRPGGGSQGRPDGGGTQRPGQGLPSLGPGGRPQPR